MERNHTETPRIIRESSTGLDAYSILEDMLAHRELECVGELNDERFYSLSRQLRYLQREDPQGEIVLYLSGAGGSISSALALCDVVTAVSCPVRVVCMGRVSCPGALVQAVGDWRELLPHSQINLYMGASARVGVGADAADPQRERVVELLSRRTGRTEEETDRLLRADRWLTAEEAVELKLAQRVIQSL